MPSVITFPLLQTINAAVSLAFNTQLWAVESRYKPFTYDGPSDGPSSIYPRLDLIPGMREWLGDRVVHSLSVSSFSIRNKTFENTIAAAREDIEDDRYGLLTPAASMLGQSAAELPDLLIAQLMKAGHTAPTYDGQNFFDLSHPNPNADGSAGTIANYQAGAGPAWYLVDTRRGPIKPFIFQRRRPFVLTPRVALDDPNVFDRKEFVWGVDGRCNAGYGLWQVAFMSLADLNSTTLTAARTAMASIRRPNGTPMGLKPDLLVVPSTLYPTAKALCENEFLPFDNTAGVTALAPNTVRGMFTAYENEWLN